MTHYLYPTWRAMIYRCTRKHHADYYKYGGRGIYVCDRWLDFNNFVSDMGERPDGHSLERKDNEGPYSPENCIWATPLEQANNRRTVATYTYAGATRSAVQWAREVGVHPEYLKGALRLGIPFDVIMQYILTEL